MSQQQHPYNQGPASFWDFVASLDPDRAPGGGVDHTGGSRSGSSFPQFPPGFPFGPRGRPPHGAPPHPDPWSGGFGWGGTPWWVAPDNDSEEDEPGRPWWQARGPGRHQGGRRGGRREQDAEGHPEENLHRQSGQENTDPDEVFVSDVDMAGDAEKRDSPDTMREDVPDPAEVAPEDGDGTNTHNGHTTDLPYRHGRHGGCRGGFGRRGGPGGCGRGRRSGPHDHRGPRRGGPHHHGRFPSPPPYPGAGANSLDFGALFRNLAQHPMVQNHPFMQNLRRHTDPSNSNGNGNNAANDPAATTDDDHTFLPPVDVFTTDRAFILHVALPGARKEDIGVEWDADAGVLRVAGVVHRPGDEAFLQTLTSAERRVGVFERSVKLPPPSTSGVEQGQEREQEQEKQHGAGGNEEVDGQGITARMEDGILVITVPKVEKEWTEIRKVDIE